MLQYYVLTVDPNFAAVLEFVQHHQLRCSVHLNRTRFWVPDESSVLTEFLLRFAHCCTPVDPELDLVTGRAWTV